MGNRRYINRVGQFSGMQPIVGRLVDKEVLEKMGATNRTIRFEDTSNKDA